MIPTEYSSAGRQRVGGLSKQGNPLLRFLWCEAAVHAVRRDPEMQRFYRRKLIQKGLGKARVQTGDSALAVGSPPPRPKAPAQLGANPEPGGTMASRTARAPSLSRAPLCCQPSKIRAVCARERSYGSVRGYQATDIPTATRDLKQRGVSVRVGIEATGYSRWFERLLTELGFEVWIGNAAEIKTQRVRKQKTDRKRCSRGAQVAAGKSFSTNLGTESGESRSTAVAMASVSVGPDTD